MRALRSKLADEVLADPKARELLREFILSRVSSGATDGNATMRIRLTRSNSTEPKEIALQPTVVTE